jgi:hypothetical protein
MIRGVVKVFLYKRLYDFSRYVEAGGGGEHRREVWKKKKIQIRIRNSRKLWKL